MKRTVFSVLMASGLLAVAGSAMSAELVTTVAGGKGNTAISFDLMTDVEVAAFNFVVNIPGLGSSKASVGRCGGELPAGFEAKCQIVKDSLMMFANSTDPSIGIGPGLVGVGTVELSGASFAKGNVTVTALEAFDQGGNSVGLSSKLDMGSTERVVK